MKTPLKTRAAFVEHQSLICDVATVLQDLAAAVSEQQSYFRSKFRLQKGFPLHYGNPLPHVPGLVASGLHRYKVRMF